MERMCLSSPPAALRIALPAAIFLLTCLMFLPAVWNGFVTLDDPKNFLDNQNFRGLGWENVRWAWTTFHNGAYQPLSWILFSAQYVGWQLNPLGYHLVSLLLQGINAVLFYWLALRLLALAMPPPNPEQPLAMRLSAALAAMLFSIHPLRTEAVAWLSTQPYLTVGMFYLLCLLAYLRACTLESTRRPRILWLSIACACYCGSILSKGVGVGLIAVLVILDIYPLRRLWPGKSHAQIGPPTWVVLLEKLPFLVLGLVSAWLALLSKREAMVPLGSYDIPHRIVQAAWGIMFYVHKTVLPTGLSPWYQLPEGFSVWEPRFVISVILVLVVTIAAIRAWKRYPAVTMLWFYYLVVLLPLSHLVRLGRQAAADRYSYVSCMGWALLGGAGWLAAWRARAEGRIGRPQFRGIGIAACAFCVFLGAMSWRQTQFWRDGVALWSRAVEVSPDIAIPRSNLALELRSRGDLVNAAKQAQEAIRLEPNESYPRVNLAMVLLDMGRPDLAIEQLKLVLSMRPNDPHACGNLGGIYVAMGRYDEAIEYLQKASAGPNPPDARTHLNLATALTRKKRPDEAIRHCREALKIEPEMAEAYSLWGAALSTKGDNDAAIRQMRRALEIDAHCVAARLNLARVLAAQQQHRQALDVLRACPAGEKTDPRVPAELVRMLLSCPQPDLRNPSEALHIAEEAHRQSGRRNAEVLEVYAAALAANDMLDQAVVVGRQAIELARLQNRTDLVARISQAVETYQRR